MQNHEKAGEEEEGEEEEGDEEKVLVFCEVEMEERDGENCGYVLVSHDICAWGYAAFVSLPSPFFEGK